MAAEFGRGGGDGWGWGWRREEGRRVEAGGREGEAERAEMVVVRVGGGGGSHRC